MRVLAALVTLVILGWLAWVAFTLFWGGLTSLEPAVLSPLLLASGTLMGVVVTVVGGQAFQRAAAREDAQRPRKIEIYERFMKEWADVLQLGKPRENRQTQEPSPAVVEYLGQFSREVILWGSAGVVKAYSHFMQVSRGAEGNPQVGEEAVFAFEKTLLHIRSDLGHSNRGLAEGDVLRLFVTDIEQVLARRRTKR